MLKLKICNFFREKSQRTARALWKV